MKIAITGASGFIGRHVVNKALELNAEIHVFGRKDYGLPGTYHYWDAVDQRMIPPNEKFDAIIHCAAATKEFGDDVFQVNTQGTANALNIDQRAKFIHISSASIYGHQENGLNISEDQSGQGIHLNDYSSSKFMAEQIVKLEHRQNGVFILRPQAVYGPGDTTILPRLEQRSHKRKLYLPNRGEAVLSITRVESFVDVIFDIIAMPFVSNGDNWVQDFNVADHSPSPLWYILGEISSQRKPIRIKNIPLKMAWTLAHVSEIAYRMSDRKKDPSLTRYMVSHLGYNMTLRTEKLERFLERELPESDFSDASAW